MFLVNELKTMNTNLIILAGGMSSRMKRPIDSGKISNIENEESNNRSKSLISYGKENRPILDYLLYNAKKAGYKSIYIVINKKGKLFYDFYGKNISNNIFRGLKISFIIQNIPPNRIKPLGTADALYQALEQYPLLKKEEFTVCNSDNLYSTNALKLLSKTKHDNAFISYNREYLKFSLEKILSFAVMEIDKKNYLKSIIEKPSVAETEKIRSNDSIIRVSMNIFKLNGDNIYSFLKNCPINKKRNEKELPQAILNMINNSKFKISAIHLNEHVPDLTAKDDILIVKNYIRNNFPSKLDW